ncbi:MAG TPA: hypothetical protein VGU74_05425 [Gemmatimonadales bacterium]|nr:hypothetical protein [Gemmatimonadales bacterium]
MNWPHVHLMLNHVPVLGTVFGFALLAWGLWRRDTMLQRAALVTFIVAALIAIPVFLTGEPSEDAVKPLAGIPDSAIEAHEEAAVVSLIAVEFLGALALAALLIARSRFRPTIVLRGALGVAIVTVALMAWTANLGGRIRHSELRASGTRGPAQEEHEQRGEGR